MPACLALCLHGMGCQMACVSQVSILGRWCSMQRRRQKVPQEQLQARGGFELAGSCRASGGSFGICFCGRAICLHMLPVGVLRYSLSAFASRRPSDGRSLCLHLARQVHVLLASACRAAHVIERARILGRACQDASASGTHRAHMHTKAFAMQGLGVGMGMVQSSALPRSGVLFCSGGMDVLRCASTGCGLGYCPATHSTAGMEQPAATMCAHADWCDSLWLWCCSVCA
jgi:hypothetical protein